VVVVVRTSSVSMLITGIVFNTDVHPREPEQCFGMSVLQP
jgi:hypothetical protein